MGSNINIDAKTAGIWNFYSNMANLISREAFSLRLLPQLLQNSASYPEAISSGEYSQGQLYTSVLNVRATFPVLKCIAAGKISPSATELKAALHSAFSEAVQNGRYHCQ